MGGGEEYNIEDYTLEIIKIRTEDRSQEVKEVTPFDYIIKSGNKKPDKTFSDLIWTRGRFVEGEDLFAQYNGNVDQAMLLNKGSLQPSLNANKKARTITRDIQTTPT